ncbi:YgaP family membrane protein [Natranaeroarchaeum aerophilus]|uniref:DUF2892 domain-containing protein n=1 Tax=Natranaeroarchaeum aerophilus TaxID=2917711 RepID=A0AAE3K6A8_9EURY|nr:DUF2892 domain-containing protein [Natranaeroarchaeum aerophilus]MCL9812624.1 DUF2892 domain-containing protein [Natranaeroarchaeum aerophilus]
MNMNVGSMDRQVRTGVGAITGLLSIAILGGVLALPETLAAVLGIVAIVMLGTAATGTCGLYSVLGVDTCSLDSDAAK